MTASMSGPPAIDPAASRRRLPADARVGTWTAADGWPIRRFDRAGTGRGSILFQTGRADMYEKYLETFDHWHRAGWSVTAFDWRGQGGSGRLAPAQAGAADQFDALSRDLAGFWRDWTGSTPGPHVAMGHSMGGFLILRALAHRTIAPDAAVLVAPMLGIRSPVGARPGAWFARWMASRGDAARAAWDADTRPGVRASRQKLLTADTTRYADEGFWYDSQPGLRLGAPSWGWLAAAFAATARLRRDPSLKTLQTPVLMLVAERDGLVDAPAALRVAERLPDAGVIRFGDDCAHEILREADGVRTRALAAIDRFLAERAGPR